MAEAWRFRRLPANEIAWPRGSRSLPDVSHIIERVRAEGDAVLREFAATFGDPEPRAVPREEWREAHESLPADTVSALEGAAGRIRTFAQAQRAALNDIELVQCGIRLGHTARAIERVGAYVPAGRHPLPSSLLMCVIPARIAGVRNVSVCSPRATPETLAAAYIAQADAFFEIGGAQAIAALAYGTSLVPCVDLIVGPGNTHVTAAKRAVFGDCGIDGLAGPSELLVIASADADASLIAADLLAQAEHDTSASVMLLTDEAPFVEAVEAAVAAQIVAIETQAVAREALIANGCASVLPLSSAIQAANRIAPEHLALVGSDAEGLASRAANYGSLFIGAHAAPAFGDYGAGPNHVLPTNGTARHASGLSVLTFLTLRTYERAAGNVADILAEHAAQLAALEGLDAHRKSTVRDSAAVSAS